MRLTPVMPWLVRPRRAARAGPVSVCFVIDRLSSAGTEKQLVALLRHLDRDRVRPSLCLLDGREEGGLSPPADCPTICLRMKRLFSPSVATAGARLAAFWRQRKVDVVVTYFLDSTYFAAPLARLCGVQRVVRVRNNAGYWLTPLHRHLGRIVGRLCDVTLTNSEAGRQAIVAAEGVSEYRVRVLENGVDLDLFVAAPPPDTGRDMVRVGAVANLRPVKNIDGLIRAAVTVCQSHPQVRFEVTGEGEERTELERQIRAAGLGEQFVLRGAMSDVPAFLATLDIAVLCSHSESMSNALLEYMAAGRAIVATDVGSNARVARPGREALIVPPHDDDALAEAIGRLLNEPALARTLGDAARTRTATEFGRDAMVRRFEEFFASVVK